MPITKELRKGGTLVRFTRLGATAILDIGSVEVSERRHHLFNALVLQPGAVLDVKPTRVE